MGLITKKLKIKICPQNVNYYNDLGYDIPKHWSKNHYKYSYTFGSFIEVNVSDLPPHSREKIEYMCDNCEKIFTSTYANYSKMKKINNKCYCQKCSLAIYNSGENHPLWNFNITDDERIYGRKYPEYIEFTKKVLTRDKYTCQCCGKKNGIVHEVHHLDGYNWCIEKRTDETNGITLCKTCHSNFHAIYGHGDNTKEQFEEWLGNSILNLEKYNGDLSNAKKVYCIEDNLIIDSLSRYCKENNLLSKQFYECCNGIKSSAHGKHYVWYDDYIKMSTNEINLLLMSGYYNKQIICINNKKIFKNAKCAAKYFNVNKRYVSDCCNDKMEYIMKNNEKIYLKHLRRYMEEENISNISELDCEFVFND